MNSFLYSVYFHQAIGSKDHLQKFPKLRWPKIGINSFEQNYFLKIFYRTKPEKDTHQKQRKSGKLSKRINVQVDWHPSNAAILKYIDAYTQNHMLVCI